MRDIIRSCELRSYHIRKEELKQVYINDTKKP